MLYASFHIQTLYSKSKEPPSDRAKNDLLNQFLEKDRIPLFKNPFAPSVHTKMPFLLLKMDLLQNARQSG